MEAAQQNQVCLERRCEVAERQLRAISLVSLVKRDGVSRKEDGAAPEMAEMAVRVLELAKRHLSDARKGEAARSRAETALLPLQKHLALTKRRAVEHEEALRSKEETAVGEGERGLLR